jgi:hypothetical protein
MAREMPDLIDHSAPDLKPSRLDPIPVSDCNARIVDWRYVFLRLDLNLRPLNQLCKRRDLHTWCRFHDLLYTSGLGYPWPSPDLRPV